MIFWITIAVLVVLISFVLAVRSMADFAQNPHLPRYALYLIRSPQALTGQVLDAMHSLLLKKSSTISLERLIKGRESALVIFAPTNNLNSFSALDLVELEDYVVETLDNWQAWQMGVKHKNNLQIKSYFEDFPPLQGAEQFWWQMVLKRGSEKGYFEAQVRVIVRSQEESWQKRTAGSLQKIPKPFKREQLLDFYQKRTFLPDKFNPTLTSREVLEVLSLS